MLKKLQQTILQLSVMGERRAQGQTLRRFVLGGTRMLGKPDAVQQLESLADYASKYSAMVASWVEPDSIARREGGDFDARDLRHWIELAKLAGVAHVPAREILHLTEEELSALSGEVEIPDNAAGRKFRQRIAMIAAMQDAAEPTGHAPGPDLEELDERLHAAMDDVPEGWMVRSNLCGGSNLKSLAGFGGIGHQIPEVRFGPDLEIGPGWVRTGNRRRIHAADMRTIEAAVEGKGDLWFLARPWIESSRYIVGPDPHRHGTPFAGKGVWPAEWRAIAVDGQIVGVASYYSWCDEANPKTARTALAVRDLAQRIADEAVRQGAFPKNTLVEAVRGGRWVESTPSMKEALDGPWGPKSVSFTLDFIETDQGLMMLEGGPSVSPVGGGHPCAFAGVITARHGDIPNVSGVAFRVMDGVIVADPSTWNQGDRTGRILDWDEVEDLASEGDQ